MSTRRVDLNRQKKIYPYIRRKPVYGRMDINENVIGAGGGISAEIETAELPWNGTDSITHTFTSTFTAIPKVVAISKSDNINVFVENVSLTSVTIRASAPSSEHAYLHAINML